MEAITEPTKEIGIAMCKENGHKPMRVIADNGFTYETICGRCAITI